MGVVLDINLLKRVLESAQNAAPQADSNVAEGSGEGAADAGKSAATAYAEAPKSQAPSAPSSPMPSAIARLLAKDTGQLSRGEELALNSFRAWLEMAFPDPDEVEFGSLSDKGNRLVG